MPKDLPEPKEEDYALCPDCTKAEGSPVYYHKRRGLREVKGFFSAKTHFECPAGHKIEVTPAPA